MPHIEGKRRVWIDEQLRDLLAEDMKIADIEYILSQFVQQYIINNGLRFQTLEEVDGLFGTAAKEFYRVVIGPYEFLKAYQNGNAYQKLVEMIDELVKKNDGAFKP